MIVLRSAQCSGRRQPLNPAHHRLQTAAPGGTEMFDEVEALEVAIDIEVADLLCGLAVVGSEHHPQQSLHDKGIAVDLEEEALALLLRHQPHLALAATHKVFLAAPLLVQRRQFLAQVDDVFVAVFPAVEEGQCLHDIVRGDLCAEAVVGHGNSHQKNIPVSSWASSLIMSRLQGGSNTSSTVTDLTLGTRLTRYSTSPTSTGPMPQLGAVSVMLISTLPVSWVTMTS